MDEANLIRAISLQPPAAVAKNISTPPGHISALLFAAHYNNNRLIQELTGNMGHMDSRLVHQSKHDDGKYPQNPQAAISPPNKSGSSKLIMAEDQARHKHHDKFPLTISNKIKRWGFEFLLVPTPGAIIRFTY